MKSLHIIFTSLISLLFSACAVDNLELPINDINNSNEIKVLGHVTRFDEYDVATRSAKDGNEGKITSFAMAIFKVENGGAGTCIHYEYHETQSQLLFTINRNDENNIPLYKAGEPYVIYVFANMPGMSKYSTSSTLDEMISESYEVQDLNIPQNGFPMLGSLGDYFSNNLNQDGETFYMISDKAEHDGKPAIGDVPTTTLNIPLKALYAKINFEIEVRPDQTIEGYPAKFELQSYKVVNVPKFLDFDNSSNPDTDETIGVLDTIKIETGNVTASGANKINFSFYLPENLVEPYKKWDEFEYPFGKGSSIREQDLKYRQRYKVLLLDEDQDPERKPDRLATNIILSGIFQDHQDHSLKVDYTIYLGKDAFGDFNIERNCEYNNSITIRGILNSNDNHDNYISLDHRVNVTHTQPAIVSLRREVLLDSHFEIRPIRIKKNPAIKTGPSHVKVEVDNPKDSDWMRIERSFGNGITPTESSIYIINNQKPYANGKRKYFTHNLISGENASVADHSLVNSTEVIVPLDGENLCVWLYADECTDIGDGVREGIIKLTYGTLNGETFDPTKDESFPPVEYTINQRKLFKVDGTKSYLIEYEEEYLHNFDSEENYGGTEHEGMVWGAENIQFSYQYPAVYVDLTGGIMSFLDAIGWEMDDYMNSLISSAKPYYDFYLTRDKEALNLIEDSRYDDDIVNGVFIWNYSGYTFSQKLINKLISEGKISDGTLASDPMSAVEYCYNKNKRDINGNVVNPQWYLPAIDEIEDIVMSKYDGSNNTYTRFEDFQNKFYWSSQPAYIYKNLTFDFYIWLLFIGKSHLGTSKGKMFIDNIGNESQPGYARATKVSYNEGYSAIMSGLSGPSYDIKYEYYNGLQSPVETEIVPAPKPDEGYLSRTDMARVRCVRRIQQQ